ncbi:formate dehydrogenase subunit delta [Novosphingobium album (ex Liu et al. 2023)]|uniref:Formate dehydrogenase subunit delta n=1 Tax=Novosphingobium album (ex Liu et al. 2023) TaxID=3031130 RepID=A0ABT5WQQ5_9SPHN|nr:formate dehydrogenase subunit delta [Novosphingobium album (ex Liu et al. 2023)]MDE8652382.1 formate dehydrogenase subunit delta [Novosphingobium album (ex Liu et al. 2023)]
MSDTPERLRYMADQIARNFAAQGEDRAIAATAEHIRLYWDPRMKARIMAEDRTHLSPVVAAALERLERGLA